MASSQTAAAILIVRRIDMPTEIFDSNYKKAVASFGRLSGLADHVASAVAAERERCARIVEGYSHRQNLGGIQAPQLRWREIAAAIRKAE